MKKYLRLSILFLVIIGLIVNTIFGIYANESAYISFLEKYFSSDGDIKAPINGIRLFQEILIFSIPFFYFLKFIDFSEVRNDLKNISIIDKLAIYSIFSLTLLKYFLFLTISHVAFAEIYHEDGIFENMTFIFSLIASVLFFRKSIVSSIFINRLFFVSLCLFAFVFAMEEISWGQRIFDWDTNKYWTTINYQDETNFHNLLNPIINYVILLFNIIVFTIFFTSGKLKVYFKKSAIFATLEQYLPDEESNLYALVFYFLILHCLVLGSELMEQVLSVVLLAYSVKYIRTD